MSLYRKYRPQTFADVVGQDAVVATLEQAVAQGKLVHAYLFAGSRGTGKTSVARILAKLLLTAGIEDDVIKQQMIKGVEEGSLVDLIEIDAASNRGIDDIRNLVEKIQFSPVVASAKVYIIDEVHMLTKEAFNALLKTLEEPPPYAYFILATTELQKIPATIQSRCQRYSFRHIREEDIVRRLQYICDQEKIEADRTALRAIAHHAQGGMRDAVSLLDQLRSAGSISGDVIQERLGDSGAQYVETILGALDSQDPTALTEAIRLAEENGMAMETLAREMLSQLRLRLHASIGNHEPIDRTVACIDAVLHALKGMRSSPIPGLALETMLLSLLTTPTAAPVREQRTVAKKEVSKAVVEPPAAPTKEERARISDETPQVSAIIEAPDLTIGTVLQAWPSIVDKTKPASVKMSLKNGRVQSVEGDTVTLSFPSRFHRDRVAQKEAAFSIEDLLRDLFKRPLKLDCVTEEEKTPVAAAAPAVDLADMAAEIF